jgi:putative oxidoreductase
VERLSCSFSAAFESTLHWATEGGPFHNGSAIGAGLALLVGFHTRVAAVTLAVFTLATAVLFHNHLADQNTFIHFLKNLAITGGLLQVAAFGSGPLSVDARRLGYAK